MVLFWLDGARWFLSVFHLDVTTEQGWHHKSQQVALILDFQLW